MSIEHASKPPPWYLQFWPWFLIALPATVVVASFVTLYIANLHSDDLVVDDYYKNGLARNRQLEKQQQARALGINASIQFSPGSAELDLQGPVAAPALRLQLSHPMESDRDFTVMLSRLEEGRYSAHWPTIS